MALILNTNIKNEADKYLLDAESVKGGYGVVDNIDDLENLPVKTVVIGSLYYVRSLNELYIKKDTGWKKLDIGGGTGETTYNIEMTLDLNASKKFKELLKSHKPGSVVRFSDPYTLPLTITSPNYFNQLKQYRDENGHWPNNVKGTLTLFSSPEGGVEYSFDATTLEYVHETLEEGEAQEIQIIGAAVVPDGEHEIAIVSIMIKLEPGDDNQEAYIAQITVGGSSSDYEPSHPGIVKFEANCSEEYQMKDIYGYDTTWEYLGRVGGINQWRRTVVDYDVFVEGIEKQWRLVNEGKAHKSEDFVSEIVDEDGNHPESIECIYQEFTQLDYSYDSHEGIITIKGDQIGAVSEREIVIRVHEEGVFELWSSIRNCGVDAPSPYAHRGQDITGRIVPDSSEYSLPEEVFVQQGEYILQGITYDNVTGEFFVPGSEVGKDGNNSSIGIVEVLPDEITVVYVGKNGRLASASTVLPGSRYEGYFIEGAPHSVGVKQGNRPLTFTWDDTKNLLIIPNTEIQDVNENVIIYEIHEKADFDLSFRANDETLLKIEAVESGSGTFKHDFQLAYRYNNEGDWVNIDLNKGPQEISISKDMLINLKNNTNKLSQDLNNYVRIVAIKGDVTVSGRLSDLLGGAAVHDYCFADLFKPADGDTQHISDISNLLIPEPGAAYCFYSMFERNDWLRETPIAPIQGDTAAAYSCCNMFKDCISIASSVGVIQCNLGEYCYSHMFDGCWKITTADRYSMPAYNINASSNGCYEGMYMNCVGLRESPHMMLGNITEGCKDAFKDCYNGCIELSHVVMAPQYKGTVGQENFENWMSGVGETGDIWCCGDIEERGPSGVPEKWNINRW